MNPWQIIKQLQYLIRARTWPGSSNKVFASDSVRITAGTDERLFAEGKFVTPCALIRPLESAMDPEHKEEPDLVQASIAVRLIVAIQNDAIGQGAIIGANRQGATTALQQVTSKGRGLLEIEEELLAACEFVNALDGVELLLAASSEVAPEMRENRYVAFRDYLFNVWCTSDRFYHPPTKLVATAIGGGSVSLAWNLPPDRYDRLRMKLRRAVGATPPATVTDGTAVALSGDLATSVTDAPGVGTFSYSLFAAYGEFNATIEERYSSPAQKASVVVT